MRQISGRCSLTSCLLLAGLVTILVIFSNHEQVRREEEVTGVPALSVVGPLDRPFDSTSRPERTNIFFLKAHKCASTTFQNILMRFGLERDLSFVLPSEDNYIGNPQMFTASLIDDAYATKDGKYNIFTHHSRYNSEEVKSVMYSDAAFTTILRHPADVYESIFSYYRFSKIFNITFEELLKSPDNVIKINKRFLKRIGFNQMSWDLGFLEEDFYSDSKVKIFIDKIDKEFDLVMMSEWMEASLVLFADLMNWPLENVMSLKLNSRPTGSKYKMSDFERKWVVEQNNVDFMLYTHFLNKFRRKVIEYGEERMKEDIHRLLHLNSNLQSRCVQGLNLKGYGHTQAYKLRNEGDRLCFFAARDELSFTDYLRKIQKQKVVVLRRLELLLNNRTDSL